MIRKLNMVLEYHDGMAVPYEGTGRRSQKARTRAALVAATRDLLARGLIPTVEDAAQAADISRTTAYRYFPNQRSLLAAVHPEIDATSLLPEAAPTDPRSRLEIVMRECARITMNWEPELRTALRLSLEPDSAELPVLRRGHGIAWIEDALTPLRRSHPYIDTHRLAIAIRAATGIESFVWLVDVANLSRSEAAEMLCQTAQVLLASALTVHSANAAEESMPCDS
jgi:AcrR family transcriptional regulator